MKTRILIQLDTDHQPSLFDRIVAVDAGAEQVFAYGGIAPGGVRDLVYGAIFTRGAADLAATAIFIGGSDVAAGEQVLERARQSFLGNLRVSLMLDSGGANTTAAAAVLALERRLEMRGRRVLVLGGTGPVGQRVARLLVRRGAEVRVGSRSLDRAQAVCQAIAGKVESGSPRPTAVETGNGGQLARALSGVEAVVAAGGPGVTLLPAAARKETRSLKLLVDLNAVPPPGIEGVGPMDSAAVLDRAEAFGAIAVGGLKMKIHKAAIAKLFEASDLILDAEEILEIGRTLAR
jgi:hypothetical protein